MLCPYRTTPCIATCNAGTKFYHQKKVTQLPQLDVPLFVVNFPGFLLQLIAQFPSGTGPFRRSWRFYCPPVGAAGAGVLPAVLGAGIAGGNERQRRAQ